MTKIVFIAKVDSHIINFHLPYLKYFYEKGYETVVISEGSTQIPFVTKKINIKFGTNPFSKNTINGYSFLKEYLNNQEISLIHTHTAIASAITRLALDKEDFKGHILYTSHGFHFMKGGKLFNWIYYIPEKLLSTINDVLIVINKEDYNLATKRFSTKKIVQMPGVGVSRSKVYDNSILTNQKLVSFFKDKIFTISYVAELNDNKNQGELLKVFKKIVERKLEKVQLLLIGDGENKFRLEKQIINLNLEDHVHLLGYQKDIAYILNNTDLYVSVSQREGLGLNVIEALLNEVPAVVTDIRGHREIIKNGYNGFLVKSNIELEEKLDYLISNKELLLQLSKNAKKSVENYELSKVYSKMIKLYVDVMSGIK